MECENDVGSWSPAMCEIYPRVNIYLEIYILFFFSSLIYFHTYLIDYFRVIFFPTIFCLGKHLKIILEF